MSPSKDEALARRRAQNREAQRKFRLKQNQQKNQNNTNQAVVQPSHPQGTASRPSRVDTPRSPPRKQAIQAPTKSSRPNVDHTSGPCGLDLYGDINLLDFSNIEDLLTSGTDLEMTSCPTSPQLAEILSPFSVHNNTEYSLFGHHPKTFPTEPNQTLTPISLYSNETRRSKPDYGGPTTSSSLNDSLAMSISNGSDCSVSPSSSYSGIHTSRRASLQNDGPPDASEKDVWVSALHIAAQKGHVRIVRVLLQHGVNCNEKDSDGITPLIHAVIGDHEDVLTSLIQKDARIGETDSKERTALHWAVIQRREALLKILLGYCSGNQAMIDSHDADGITPLHLAVDIGFEAGVQVLLDSGASLNFRTRK